MQLALAIDIGGTKLGAGLVADDGTLVGSSTVPTPAADGRRMWSDLVALVDAVGEAAPTPPVVCGVGCGGPMGPAGEWVSPLNIGGWRRFPLREQLAAHLGVPVFVDNDAKALALGEGWLGAAAACRDFVAMVVSTGVGGGLVVDGRLLDGATGNAGHIGHVCVDPGGPRCACGARGCLEAMASGTAIAARIGAPAADAPMEVRRETGRLVGSALASVTHLLDLRLAVVAGSVALGYGEPFFESAQSALDEGLGLSYTAGARIVPAGLGADGPLVGAAAVGWRGLGWPALATPPVA